MPEDVISSFRYFFVRLGAAVFNLNQTHEFHLGQFWFILQNLLFCDYRYFFIVFKKIFFDDATVRTTVTSSPIIRYSYFEPPLSSLLRVIWTFFGKNFTQNIDVRKSLFSSSQLIFPSDFWIFIMPGELWLCAKPFSMHLFFIAVFQKKLLVDFMTAGVLTKLSMETPTEKPKTCRITNNEFYRKYLPGTFSRFSEETF